MSVISINSMIKDPVSEVFRRCYIKRRSIVTGQYESDWFEITEYIKKWGKVSKTLDSARVYRFTFATNQISVDNETGTFNPHTSESSLWYGYLNQQRTLVKIETGFWYRQKLVDGKWVNQRVPGDVLWDEAFWDTGSAVWEGFGDSTVFIGLISGDIMLTDKNEISFTLKPLTSVFQEYPARNLSGWTTTGMTASQFVTMLRDQTDGSSNYVFRPFFGNTTTYWDISTTTNVYANLNTSTAKDVIDKNVWEVIEKLSEAENYVPFVNRDGTFSFVSRSPSSSSTAYHFYGIGYNNTEYGQTIRNVSSYGFRGTKYYSRVELKFNEDNTATSYVVAESAFSVSPTSNPWVLGTRTLQLQNYFIANTTVATTIATAIFNEYSGLKNEITFNTSFIPHLDILDRVQMSYDPNPASQGSLWDRYSWAADATNTSEDLVWDISKGDAIVIEGTEFKFLKAEIDLDELQCSFVAREV